MSIEASFSIISSGRPFKANIFGDLAISGTKDKRGHARS